MNKQQKAELSLLFATLIWGSSFPIMSLALKSIGPYTFIALRSIVGALIFLIFAAKIIKLINKSALIGGTLIGIVLSIGNTFQVLGLSYTTPSKSGFITGLSVVFVPIIITIIHKKLPNKLTVLSVLLAVAGLFLISFPVGNSHINIGDILTLLCSIFYSFQIIFVDKYGDKCDVLALTIVELVVVAIISIVPCLFLEGFKFHMSSFNIFAILYPAIFGTALAMGIQNKMQPYTNPSHAAVIYLGEPVFSAIFSITIGDILTGRALAGCLLILFSMIVTNVLNKVS